VQPEDTIALVPYWLNVEPTYLASSDHFWWFEPVSFCKTVIYAGPYIRNSICTYNGQIVICVQTHSLQWEINELGHYLRKNTSIYISDINFVWHVLEASSTCRVYGFERLSCPIIAVIADTHHLSAPVSSLIRYISTASFTHVTCTHNQHSPFFTSALDLQYFSYPYTNLGLKRSMRQQGCGECGVVYYGNVMSRTHIRRTYLLNQILRRYAIDVRGRLSFHDWMHQVACHDQLVFTCSLNGSFSFQTLIPLICGNVVLTDTIATSNWLGSIICELPNCLIYNDLNDLCHLLSGYEFSDANKCNLLHDKSYIHLLYSSINTKSNIKLAFGSRDVNFDRLACTRTAGERSLESLLIRAKAEFGQSFHMGLVERFEHLQEQHRKSSTLTIMSRSIDNKSDEITDLFLKELCGVLPRLVYC